MSAWKTAAVKMEIRSRPRGLSFCRTRRNGILIVAYRNSVCMCIMTYSRRCSTPPTLSPFLITWIESNFLAYKYDFVYTAYIHFYFLLRFSGSTWFSDRTQTYILYFTHRDVQTDGYKKIILTPLRNVVYTHHTITLQADCYTAVHASMGCRYYIIFDIILYTSYVYRNIEMIIISLRF